MVKIIRITTIPDSLKILLKGQLQYMNKYFEVIGVSSSGKALDDLAREEGIRTYPVEMTRSVTLTKDFISLLKTCVLLRQEKPQIIHTHTPKAGIVGMLAAWFCRIPVRMHTVAGLPLLEAKGLKRILLDFVEKMTYACATRVYPNSFGLKDTILKNGYCSQSKLFVIGNGSSNGINSKYFSSGEVPGQKIERLRDYYHIDLHDFVFVFIGRLVRDKGINELVLVFENMYKKLSHIKLLLVGSEETELDPLNKETLSIIHDHPAILLVGNQPDVRSFLAISHVLAFPSYREGLPNVPLQACAMDIPCIVTDINGCNEIITDEYNGLIIPAKDPIALQEAMERLFTDKELYERLKSNTRESVIKKYDQQFLWGKIKEEYDTQLKVAGCV